MGYADSDNSCLHNTVKAVDFTKEPSTSRSADSLPRPLPAMLTTYETQTETVNMLPSSPAEDRYMTRRPRRRGAGGDIRARILGEWESLQDAWRKFGRSTAVLPITTQDTELSTPMVPMVDHSANKDEMDEVDEIIVDNLAQNLGTPTQSDSVAEASKEPIDTYEEYQAHHEDEGHRNLSILIPYYVFRRTIWNGLCHFYATSFAERDLERHYRRETWKISKVGTARHSAYPMLMIYRPWVQHRPSS